LGVIGEDVQKTRYLSVYDYGQGGIWLYLIARSPEEITAKYPELQVVSEHPDWLKGDHLRNVEARTFDIDDAPAGWLETLVKERAK
jgi:hypothetical protein